MIKAILFDMDGVLIDARSWHYEALNLALGHFGYKISLESHLLTFDGLPTKDKLEILSKTIDLPRGLHEIVSSLKQKYTIQISHQKCKPNFNHLFALSRLSDKYKIAVCSNSVRNTIETLMELSNLKQYIDLIISNEDVTNSKPSPEMYLNAFEKFSLKAEECLILEDNPNGIKAALASGGNCMKIGDPSDVNLKSILSKIDSLN
jgi:HAD superfamily hydrolase (TIGR01509 family)